MNAGQAAEFIWTVVEDKLDDHEQENPGHRMVEVAS